MSDNSVLTCNKILEAIFEQIRPHADNPEEFTSEWKRITGELDNKVKELERSMSERDELVRELLILMRTQLVKRTDESTPFDDWDLQASLGCTILRDYADFDPRPSIFGGHQCDGIKWTEIERSMMPDHPKRRFDFRGTETEGWEYCSCLDHVISNLICKAWGFSGYKKGLKPDDPETKFKVTLWRDASMYLAVLLCFGDNILDDKTFLEKIGANLDEADSPQDKLRKVLSIPEIRPELWGRIQGHIKEDDSKSPDQP